MSSTSSFYTIINDCWDATNHALKVVLNMVHTHSLTTGQGGQLDWDNIWSDAVHSHASDAEGGQLDWDFIWSDAVHSHQSNAEGSTLDHGLALTGLTDDDHTQYIRHALATAANDFLVASGSGAFVKKTLAETRTILVPASSSAGQYTGNNSVNRAIAHGLGSTPRLVFIADAAAATHLFNIVGVQAQIRWIGGDAVLAVTAPDTTNFYVGNNTSYGQSANGTAVYDWVAIG